MNLPTKPITSLQSYQMVLYDRALHPELFQMRARRVYKHGAYESEAWIMRGAHVFRFEFGTMCACELVIDQEGKLPSAGVIAAFPCAGERDFDHPFKRSGVHYMTTVQTESLSDNLYLSTHEEMLNHARASECLSISWNDGGPCLSVVDVQKYNREIHCQSYHLQAAGGVVVRTQTIFEHK